MEKLSLPRGIPAPYAAVAAAPIAAKPTAPTAPAAAPTSSKREVRVRFSDDSESLLAGAGREFLTRLGTACRVANYNDADLATPGKLADLAWAVLEANKEKAATAAQWVHRYIEHNPESDPVDFHHAWLQAWDIAVRTESERALDELMAGTVRMKHTDTVAAYLTTFNQTCAHIPNMPDLIKIRWFQEGLSAQLRPLCTVDFRGSDFTDFNALLLHTFGEEKKMTINRMISNRHTPNFPRSDRSQNNPGRQATHAVMTNGGFKQVGGKRADRPAGDASAGGGPDTPDAKRANTNGNPNKPSDILGPDGRTMLTQAERVQYKKDGRCFNCHKVGHRSDQCTAPRVPYAGKKQAHN
jgi:hypothetical protein